MDILSEFGLDPSKYRLGSLCKRGHEFQGTGCSLRHIRQSGRYAGKPSTCVECREEKGKQWREENHDRYKEYNKEYYWNNRDRHLEQHREYYKANSERIKANVKKWESENRDRVNARSREWRRKNSDKAKAFARRYRKENKDKVRVYHQQRYQKYRDEINARNAAYRRSERGRLAHVASESRRRANRSQNHAIQIEVGQLQEWAKQFLGCCAYCGNKSENPEWDHFIPIASGGSHATSNLVLACGSCNASKHAADPYEWYSRQPFFSKSRWKKILKILGKTQETYSQIPLL